MALIVFPILRLDSQDPQLDWVVGAQDLDIIRST
jgi:hypothetical protein